MSVKKYNEALAERVKSLCEGLGPQVLSQLWAVDTSFREKKKASKLRRILSGRCHPGDVVDVEQMEKARAALMAARSTLS